MARHAKACSKLRWAWVLCLALLELTSAHVRPPSAGSVSGVVAALQNARPLVLGLLTNCRDHFATILPGHPAPASEAKHPDLPPGDPLRGNPPGRAREVPAFALSEGAQGGVLGSLERQLGGAELRERARALVDPERIKAATKRREVQLRAAFSSAVLLPLQREVRELTEHATHVKDTLREQAEHVKGAVEDVLPHARAAKARKFADRVRGEDEVHRKLYCAAPLQDIVATCTDLEGYQRWTGTGIKSINVLSRTRDGSVVRYRCRALGLSFDFTLSWKRETAPSTVPFVMTFKNVGEGGLISSLNGAYIVDCTPAGVSTITFDFASELASHIPGVIKNAIGNMVVNIATEELKNYTEREALRHAQALPPGDGAAVAIREMREKVDALEGRRGPVAPRFAAA